MRSKCRSGIEADARWKAALMPVVSNSREREVVAENCGNLFNISQALFQKMLERACTVMQHTFMGQPPQALSHVLSHIIILVSCCYWPENLWKPSKVTKRADPKLDE
jgi:hypothetical protein